MQEKVTEWDKTQKSNQKNKKFKKVDITVEKVTSEVLLNNYLLIFLKI